MHCIACWFACTTQTNSVDCFGSLITKPGIECQFQVELCCFCFHDRLIRFTFREYIRSESFLTPLSIETATKLDTVSML